MFRPFLIFHLSRLILKFGTLHPKVDGTHGDKNSGQDEDPSNSLDQPLADRRNQNQTYYEDQPAATNSRPWPDSPCIDLSKSHGL